MDKLEPAAPHGLSLRVGLENITERLQDYPSKLPGPELGCAPETPGPGALCDYGDGHLHKSGRKLKLFIARDRQTSGFSHTVKWDLVHCGTSAAAHGIVRTLRPIKSERKAWREKIQPSRSTTLTRYIASPTSSIDRMGKDGPKSTLKRGSKFAVTTTVSELLIRPPIHHPLGVSLSDTKIVLLIFATAVYDLGTHALEN
ncbi:hypothetical protein P691DRAFT_782252 [Macrolepiota fuliginosa MF-IS2]|uniref:Uncharacterized protein n=1 Tax=Macrolepiota fuliginosa MF-IS2 TaxID=1400762 RepID=A0A9P5WX33_9AGAR|nr:hypothetical protein P691DRAFT_782252 [Macrolepiota fuliginosa MF-IS2]